MWNCICDCGQKCCVGSHDLLTGHTKSCGCRKTEINVAVNEIGNRYGHLVVLKKDKTLASKARWICQCDCGNVVTVTGDNLRNGHTTSCGCKRNADRHEKSIKDRTGTKIGYLTLLSREEDHITPNGTIVQRWLCRCDCGNLVVVNIGNTKSCGCLSSTLEKETTSILQTKKINYKKQYAYKDLKTSPRGYLRFDFALFKPDNTIVCLIECQGQQHYEDTGWFGKQQREVTDQMKRDYCAAHNIPLYEIAYNENVEQRLDEILEDLKQTHNIDLATIYDNTVPSQCEAA